MKNKIVAALLALFLGGLGVHWFYLNKTKVGVLYIVILILGFMLTMAQFPFLTWGFGVLIIIDFFHLLIMDDKKFNEEYNS